jgi:hypothetical protein
MGIASLHPSYELAEENAGGGVGVEKNRWDRVAYGKLRRKVAPVQLMLGERDAYTEFP